MKSSTASLLLSGTALTEQLAPHWKRRCSVTLCRAEAPRLERLERRSWKEAPRPGTLAAAPPGRRDLWREAGGFRLHGWAMCVFIIVWLYLNLRVCSYGCLCIGLNLFVICLSLNQCLWLSLYIYQFMYIYMFVFTWFPLYLSDYIYLVYLSIHLSICLLASTYIYICLCLCLRKCAYINSMCIYEYFSSSICLCIFLDTYPQTEAKERENLFLFSSPTKENNKMTYSSPSCALGLWWPRAPVGTVGTIPHRLVRTDTEFACSYL